MGQNLPPLPSNLSEILSIDDKGIMQPSLNQQGYNPKLVRNILSEIQSGKNLGLPELAGDMRQNTLQQLLPQQENIKQQQVLPQSQNIQTVPNMSSNVANSP